MVLTWTCVAQMPETQEYAPRDLAALGGPLTVVVHGEPTWQPRTDDDSASEAHSVDPSEMAPSELSFAPPSESVDVSELLVGVTRGPL